MDAATFDLLREIRTEHGPKEFGKIAQKLLAVTFCRLGYELNEERAVQGVDIDIQKDDSKYSLEVKTTDGDVVTVAEKDLSGLRRREMDGYIPSFAVIKVSLLSDWVIASGRGIPMGRVRIGRFATQAIQPLQDEVNRIFSGVISDYGGYLLKASRGNIQSLADQFLAIESGRKI